MERRASGEPSSPPASHDNLSELRPTRDIFLADGRIGSEEAAWLRELIIADNRFDDDKYKFLHRLKGEIEQPGPEFAAILEGSREEPR
jgi:hypothetical protein